MKKSYEAHENEYGRMESAGIKSWFSRNRPKAAAEDERNDRKLTGVAASIVEAKVAVIAVLNHDFPQDHRDGVGLELEGVRVKGAVGVLRRGLGEFRE